MGTQPAKNSLNSTTQHKEHCIIHQILLLIASWLNLPESIPVPDSCDFRQCVEETSTEWYLRACNYRRTLERNTPRYHQIRKLFLRISTLKTSKHHQIQRLAKITELFPDLRVAFEIFDREPCPLDSLVSWDSKQKVSSAA